MDLSVACGVQSLRAGLVKEIESSARAVEESGLATWWALGDRDAAERGSADAHLTLQAAARVTERIRLATTGDLVAVHSPGVRAKQVASLDWFASGRLEWSVDLGPVPSALRDPSQEVDPDPLATSLEHCAAMSALWTQDRASHHGERVRFDGAIAKPKPRGGVVPPVHVRLGEPDLLRGWRAGGGRVDGWLAWMTPADELAARADELAAPCDGVRPRTTWFVPAAEVALRRSELRHLGLAVDELVAVLDHLPTPADLAALVARAA